MPSHSVRSLIKFGFKLFQPKKINVMELNWHASDLKVACTQSRARSSLFNSVPNQRAYIVLKPKEKNKIIPDFLKTLFYEFI